MAIPKYKSSDLKKLYPENQENNLRDKRIIEALRERLNEKLLNDPKAVKKAALILENWINKKK